jgi:hypothetical protein
MSKTMAHVLEGLLKNALEVGWQDQENKASNCSGSSPQTAYALPSRIVG